MRLLLCLIGLLCLFAGPLASSEISPAVSGIEGQRTFDDLAAVYRDEKPLDSERLWKQLHSADSVQRERAGQYLLAICQQTYADESSGRDVYSFGLFPGFGERPSSRAREIRRLLVSQLPDRGVAVESLPAIDWILAHDLLADTQLAAVTTLRKIRDPAADDLLLSCLSVRPSNGAVLVAALEEVSARNLRKSATQLALLSGDYPYQYRAVQLTAQLPGRAKADFLTLQLPTPRQWHRMRRQLSRADQIDYLADRLRLICCPQLGWPCDFNVRDQQWSKPPGGDIYTKINLERGVETINPFTELSKMTLEPSELAPLIPHMADDHFLLTYHFWRPWDSRWNVFPVNELVEALINESAGRQLADLSQYNALSPDDRPEYLASLTSSVSEETTPRVVRSLLDLGAMLQRPVEPILGIITCLLAWLWYRWKRSSPELAALGAIVFLSFGMIALWYPALRQQRVLLAIDAIPPIICVVGASILLRLHLHQSWTRVLLFTAVIWAAAWMVDRYVFLGRCLNAYWLAAFVLLSWPCCRTLYKSRAGWGWALLASVLAIVAVAPRVYKDVFATLYHFEINPDFPPPFFLTHPVWTLAAVLACGSLLLCVDARAKDVGSQQR